MQTFDLLSREVGEGRAEIFSMSDKNEFVTRLIQLDTGEEIPPLKTDAHIIFVVMSGEVEFSSEEEEGETTLTGGKCLVSPPASISLRANQDSRVLEIKIDLCPE